MIEQYTSPVAVNNSQEPWLVGEGVVVSGGVAIPSLDFNFITGGLPGTVTFTRASTATYFNSAGTLTSAAINEARFDYNPSTLAARGLLIEEQRANNYTYSATFDDPVWTKTRSSITANTVVSPDGESNGDKLVEDTTASSTHTIAQLSSFVSGTTYTYSIFVKQGERTAVRILFPAAAFTSNLTANFDISTGAWRTTSPSPSAGLTLAVQTINNGWYRISVTATATTTASSTILLYLLDLPSSTGSYTGNGTSGLFLWGAQLEAGAFPTSYIPTVATALTRSTDVATVNTLTPWFNATEGTLFAQAEVPVITQTGRTMASIGRAVASAYELILNITSTGAPGLPVATILASTTQFQYQPTPERFSTKGALAYKENDSQAAFDGTASATDTSVTLPDLLATLYIGKRDDITPLNGWLKRVTYYPRRLSQAELESITA